MQSSLPSQGTYANGISELWDLDSNQLWMVQPEIRPTHSPVEVGRLSHRWHCFYTFFNTFQVVGLGISEPSTSINRMVCVQSVTMPILRSWRIHLMIPTYSNSYDRHPWQPLRWRNLLHVNWVWKTKDSSQGPFSEDSCHMFWMVFGVFWVHHCTSIAHKNSEFLSSHFFTLTPLSFDVCFFSWFIHDGFWVQLLKN